MDWLGGIILGTYALQTAVLIRFPVPSPVSASRIGAVDRSAVADEPTPPGGRGTNGLSAFLSARSIVGPLAAGAASLPPLVLLLPRLRAVLVPLPVARSVFLDAVSACLLTIGNLLVLAAVRGLRREVRFGADGQGDRLLTRGVFAIVRHPIVVGMGIIWVGLLAALPSVVLLVGLVLFGLHQSIRIRQEERLLCARFGPPYRAYRQRVGRFWPRVGRWPSSHRR